jgi:hypothetical protein
VGIVRSNLQLEALLQRLATEVQDCETLVEVEANVVRFWIRSDLSPGRVASISRFDRAFYALNLDHLYVMAWVDEDLTFREEEEEIRRLSGIGESYVKNGGRTGQTKFLRTPYVEVLVDKDMVRVYRPLGRRGGVSLSPWERLGG